MVVTRKKTIKNQFNYAINLLDNLKIFNRIEPTTPQQIRNYRGVSTLSNNISI